MATPKASEVVRRYAVTLLEAADEAGVTDRVRRDLEGLAATLHGSAELTGFLGDPLVDSARVAAVLEQVFRGKVEGLTLNMLQLVAQRRRARLLAEIVAVSLQLLEERAGVDTASVRCATPLSPSQLEALRQRLSRYTGRAVRVQVEVDGSLRGGLVARIGDTVFDGSVETQLARLRQRLVGA